MTTWSPGASGGDALADPLDDARALVPEHRRRVAGGVGAGRRVQIGVADAAGDETHEHLARLGLGQVDLLHLERPTELLENCGANLHLACPTSFQNGATPRSTSSRPASPR